MMKNSYSFDVFYSQLDEAFIAKSPEWGEQVIGVGDTRAEALDEAETNLEMTIELHQRKGNDLPEPRKVRDYSGNISLRIPQSLHAQVAKYADQEGVSINQFINYALTSAVTKVSEAFNSIRQLQAMRSQVYRLLNKLDESNVTGKDSDTDIDEFVPMTTMNKNIKPKAEA